MPMLPNRPIANIAPIRPTTPVARFMPNTPVQRTVYRRAPPALPMAARPAGVLARVAIMFGAGLLVVMLIGAFIGLVFRIPLGWALISAMFVLALLVVCGDIREAWGDRNEAWE